MVVSPSSQSLRALIELLNTRKLLILYQSFAQTKDTDILTMLFVRILNYKKRLSYRRIRSQHNGHPHIISKSILSTRPPYQMRIMFVLLQRKWQRRLAFLTQNLQKQLLLEYDHKSKTKTQKWAKLTANKKSLITIIFGQQDDATRTKIALGTN